MTSPGTLYIRPLYAELKRDVSGFLNRMSPRVFFRFGEYEGTSNIVYHGGEFPRWNDAPLEFKRY